MRTIKKSGITALTAALALSLGGVPAWLLASEGAGVSDNSVLGALATTNVVGSSTGSLILSTSTSRVTGSLKDHAGATTTLTQQTLIPSKSDCLLKGTENLLSISGDVGTGATDLASYANGSIGVAEKKTGTSCSQVGASTKERLVLSLGSDLRGKVLFDAAGLDVELKQSAVIRGVGYVNANGDNQLTDSETVATFNLFSGASSPLAGAGDYQCTGSADSGPDSGASDNCMWPIGSVGDDVAFDTIVLTADVGSFSLEGGSDGAGTTPSTFDLVSNTFDCNTSRSLPATGGAPAVTGTRLSNADGSTCTPLTFAFSNGTSPDGAFAELLKPADVDPTAQFVYDFVWTVDADIDPTGDAVTSGLVERTTVDFDSAATFDDPTPIASCPDLIPSSVTIIDENGTKSTKTFLVVDNAAAKPDLAPNIDGTQFACIVTQSIGPILGTNTQKVTEQIYAYGDILMRK